MNNTFTLFEVNRAFYEKLRLKLVDSGFLPDIVTFLTMEQDLITAGTNPTLAKKQASTAYQNACKALSTYIEVFGVGDYSGRGEFKGSMFVIDRLHFDKGNVGTFKEKFYVDESGILKEYELPKFTRNIFYQISYATNEVRLDNAMNQILFDTFGVQGWLKGIKDDGTETEGSFEYAEVSNADTSDGKYIERSFRYEAKNLHLETPKLTNDNVSMLQVFIPSIETTKKTLF